MSRSPSVLVEQALARLKQARKRLARAEDGLTKADDFNARALDRAVTLREETRQLITAAQRLIAISTR
jgi:hypothetical protein